MKKLLLLALLLLPSFASAQFTIQQGGTGLTTFTAGDIPYAASTNPLRFTKLPIGGAGTCLTSNGSTPVWGGCGGGGAGSGTVSTSTALVSGQVDFSTSASTIGNDSSFLFSTALKRLTFTYGSTTAFTISGAAYIPNLSNLTSNGFVKTTGSNGALSIDTNTYLTSAITSLGALNQGQTGATQTLATSTTGTNFTITSSGDTQTFNLPVASASNTGKLSSTDWSTFNGKQAAGNYITALTGDVSATGPGSVASTLATVNGNVGSFTNANITVNGKGLITAASSGSTPEVPLTFTWPLIRTTNTITFGGLSTSSAAVIGNIPYFSGVNTFANVATTSASCSGTVSCSSFTVLGASPITITGTGGGGSGSSTFSTSTSSVAGENTNHPTVNTDIVTIGSSSTTTAPFYFDPNIPYAVLNSNVTVNGALDATEIIGHANSLLDIEGGAASANNNGGGVSISSANGGTGVTNGGDIIFSVGAGNGGGTAGDYKFYEDTGAFAGILDFSLLSADRNYTFPNSSGTLCLKDNNCTSTSTPNVWSGLQTFGAGFLSQASSTIVGNATTTGSMGAGAIYVNGDYITDFTGTNLSVTNGVLNASGGGSSFAYPFTVQAGYQSTSTTLAFTNGFFSTASSTISGNFYLPSLSQGFLYSGSNGLTNSIASSSVKLSWFNNDSGFTTFSYPFPAAATSTTLTFSGGLLSTASSTQSGNFFLPALSQGLLYNGSAGLTRTVSTSTLTASSPLTGSFTQIGSGGSLGCTTAASGVAGCLSNTAFDIFNNKLGSYDAFTHPSYSGASATTSLIGIGTTTPKWALTIASSTGPQLTLTDTTLTSSPFNFNSIGNWLFISTSSPTTFATTSTSILSLNGNAGSVPSLVIGTSSPTTAYNGSLNLGSNGASGTTTLFMGKIQYDGYNSAGARICTYINSGNTWSVQVGACLP